AARSRPRPADHEQRGPRPPRSERRGAGPLAALGPDDAGAARHRPALPGPPSPGGALHGLRRRPRPGPQGRRAPPHPPAHRPVEGRLLRLRRLRPALLAGDPLGAHRGRSRRRRGTVSQVRRLAVNLGLSVAVSFLFLGALEGLARVFETRRVPPPPVADYIWDWSEKMPGAVYAMKPEAAGWPA